MTNADKAELRRIMRNEPDKWTDTRAASECECSVATAKKYRRIFAPPPGNCPRCRQPWSTPGHPGLACNPREAN